MSGRTVYLYFLALEQLLTGAAVGMLSQAAVDEAIGAADTGGDAIERVAVTIRAVGAMCAETLPLGRSLIRLTVDPLDGTKRAAPWRGSRRIAWIERALEPLRPHLDSAHFDRLVSALAMVAGWEALIILQDLLGLGPAEQAETAAWAAQALVRAALHEQD